MKINEVCERIDEVVNFSKMSDAKLKKFIAGFDSDESMGQAAGMQLKAAKKEARKRGILNEVSISFPSDDFSHTEKFSVESGREIEFAQYVAQQLEIMGVTKEQATRLYKASKDGDYSWVERFGASPKLKALIGHNIGTAMTSNAVAIHNGMGLHAGLLKIQPKQTRIQKPSRIPDDLQPGGHDTDEYQYAKDERQAQQYRDPVQNWSGLR